MKEPKKIQNSESIFLKFLRTYLNQDNINISFSDYKLSKQLSQVSNSQIRSLGNYKTNEFQIFSGYSEKLLFEN